MNDTLTKVWWLLSRREKRNAFLLVFLLIINGLMEMVGVGIVPVYVSIVAFPDRLTENEYIRMLLTRPDDVITQTTLLYWGSGLLLLFFSIKAGYSLFLSYWQARFVQNRVLRIGDRLFTAYMRAPYVFHLGRNSAQLLRNVNTEAQQVGSTILMPLIQFVTRLFILFCITGLLIAASPGLASLALMAFTVVAFVIVGVLQRKLRLLGREAQTARGNVVKSINEGLGGVKEIKIMQRERLFTERYREFLGTTLRINRFMMMTGQAIPHMMEWISVVGLLSVILVLFAVGSSTEIVVSTVVLFAVSLGRLKVAISSLISEYSSLQHNAASLDVICNDLVELEQSIPEVRNAQSITTRKPLARQNECELSLEDTLTLKNVTYRYPHAARDAIRGITLNIKKGDAVGFVGATGAGKSTLIDIVLGVLRPTGGEILVDGEDIHCEVGVWQRNVGYIPQSTYLVDGSIRANIALGLPLDRIDGEALNQAVKAAHVDEFMADLPQGVDTVVGERGVRLSGGQRQRIAIARAIYHNPAILVMDEATSALDNATEKSVIQAVEELKGERTILMIAHRLSTVRNCDRIVVLDQGQIESVGTYEELLHASEGFQRLVGT